MKNPTVQPPKAPEGFWEKYSAHVTQIKLNFFELEEIDRMVDAYAVLLDGAVDWRKNSKVRATLLNAYREDLVCRTHRAALLERYIYGSDTPPPMDS